MNSVDSGKRAFGCLYCGSDVVRPGERCKQCGEVQSDSPQAEDGLQLITCRSLGLCLCGGLFTPPGQPIYPWAA